MDTLEARVLCPGTTMEQFRPESRWLLLALHLSRQQKRLCGRLDGNPSTSVAHASALLAESGSTRRVRAVAFTPPRAMARRRRSFDLLLLQIFLDDLLGRQAVASSPLIQCTDSDTEATGLGHHFSP